MVYISELVTLLNKFSLKNNKILTFAMIIGFCINGNYLHTGLNLAPMGTIVTLTPAEFKMRFD